MSQCDLLIRAGRVFCARSGLDGRGAIAVSDGRILAAGPDVNHPARQVLEYPDGLLLPGLVDFHAHPDAGGSRFGIDPDRHLLPYGTTTAMSQGDAGAANWECWRDGTAAKSQTRLRLALNLGALGEATPGGCFAELSLADVDACAAAVERAGDLVWGIAVNTSVPSCGGTDPREVLRRGLEVAERTGKPLLFGSRRAPDWPLADQLPLLRSGDVVTYCFSPDPDGILDGERVDQAVWEARSRGVLFDLGHGMGSFSFRVAEIALAEGFYPDSLSTDFYRRHVEQVPHHDLPRVLSKLIACGMPESEAFARATMTPARLLCLGDEVGSLQAGACADLTILSRSAEVERFWDTVGAMRYGRCWRPVITVRAGQVIPAIEEG